MSRAWYPRYIRDYLADTTVLSLAGHGFYNLMLDYLYLNDGKLPADLNHISRLLRLDKRVVRRYLGGNLGETCDELDGEVGHFFSTADGYITNNRVTIEVAKAIDKSNKAKVSAGKRWGCERISERNANHNHNHNIVLRTNTHSTKKELPKGFKIWWENYPRKKDKPRALKAWISGGLEERTDELVAALKNQNEHECREKQFIPFPATYLNGERWNDEIDQASVREGGSRVEYQSAVDRVRSAAARRASG